MEDRKEGGFVVWWRKTLDSQVFQEKPAEWFKIWFYLVMRANWDDGRLPRGSFHVTYKFLQDKLHVSRSTIDHFIRWAKKSDRGVKMLATRKATRGMVVTVLNYAKYQDIPETKSDSKSDSKATQERHDNKTIEQENNLYKETLPIGNLNRYKEPLTRESGAAPPPTPREEAEDFFTNGDKQRAVVEWLKAKGIPEQAAVQEVAKFVSYWTELSLSGKRQRWQTEKTFEIKRRLATWFSKSRDFEKKPPRVVVI